MPPFLSRTVSSMHSWSARWMIARFGAIAGTALIMTPFLQPETSHAQTTSCETYRITGYVRGADSPWTYDGTSVWSREHLVAASWNVPINSVVSVKDLGEFRVADRGGGLGPRHIDVLVDTRAQAYALTGWRQVCILKTGNGRTNATTRPLPSNIAPSSPGSAVRTAAQTSTTAVRTSKSTLR
jgi:3D (Asp-Asp-Asp) domain-containing protein